MRSEDAWKGGGVDEIYSGHGIRFRYPAHWEISEGRSEDQIDVSVESPGTSYWTVTLFLRNPSPQQVIRTAVGAYREEYDELDAYPAEASLCHRRAVAQNLEFVSLELINSAFLRAFRTGRYTVLVMYQGTDHELEETRETLEEMSASLECLEDADIIE